ncbi:uncharacterized protein BDR25DRAFT_343256 [Lindgomyces ingoldianus]|uniref:Uncharacterized protein n=1 Tax=Lindgomyces ingoldianus TaxID=673940 RepID=A0ACB6QSL5_9PLEO|nr:uncharacterized protein BDR25DRAFT_343256 [Lindgomyces ingoldianus]KAF2470014.1 hypothetical protein BDR25DRAFT_343256 [Lindgomyces ingoldianus]
MARRQILDLPVSIRDQIYTELLVPPVVQVDKETITQECPSINVLYTNRQIYAESSNILYASNLFTIITTNSPDLFNKLPRARTPLIEIKHPSRIAQTHRFAMMAEFLDLDTQIPSKSTPIFVASSQALPYLARGLRESVVVRFEVRNTFRYTVSRASKLLFGRFLAAERVPKFQAVQIDGPVDDEYRMAMNRDCVTTFNIACRLFHLGLIAYKDRVQFRMRVEHEGEDGHGVEEDIPEAQVTEIPKLLLRFIDIFWVCHDYRFLELGHSCNITGRAWFLMASELYCTLAQGYVMAAKRSPSIASICYRKARCAAEEGIVYLSQKVRSLDSPPTETDPEEWREAFKKAQVALSIKAANVSLALGDDDSARAYVLDALLLDPGKNYQAHAQLPDQGWLEDLSLEGHCSTAAVLWRKPAA